MGYEHFFRGALFPLYETVLRRRGTLRYFRDYRANQWLSRDELAALRWQKLATLLQYCWQEVPYYRRRWQSIGVEPGDIRDESDFAKLPMLTKDDIRANADDLVAAPWRGKLTWKATGGSTGTPLRFGYTHESYERRIAVMWRGYEWAGARMGRRTLYLWGAPTGASTSAHDIKDRVYHAAFNRRMLNAFLMSEERMVEYAKTIDAFKPEIIVSYVAPIVRMSEWLLASGRKPHRPQGILSAAEALSDSQRDTIERAFGCPVYNTYGCREVMLIAAQCERREGLHLSADHLHVELHEPTQTVRGDAAIGEVLLTDLHNMGMPLIRYANGDMATAGPAACACGRTLPLLARVDGRKLDTLRSPDGRLMPGEYFVYAFLSIPYVRQYQVVQREPNAIDVYVVPEQGFDAATEELIRTTFGRVAGPSMEIRCHRVDDIPATASGKFRVTISELKS
jgi:phenylacetate-CoA ligase